MSYPMSAEYAARPATENRIATIKKMLADFAAIGPTFAEAANAMWNILREAQNTGKLTNGFASETIVNLSGDIRRARAERTQVLTKLSADIPDVAAGQYAVDTEAGDLAFYRVWRPEDGGPQFALYVRASDEEHRISGAAAITILGKIAEDPRAAMIRFGQKIGECGACHRSLTKESSRNAGIGPTCAKKRGW